MASSEFLIEGEVAIKVSITELDGNLVFNLHVVQPGEDGYTGQIGELNGIFFDLAPDVDTFSTVTAKTDDSTPLSLDVDEASVSNLGGGINVNGEVVKEAGKFDVGIALDDTGLGNGDLQDITFTLDADVDLTLADISLQDFGLRLTSVGEPDGPRNGSLKLGGTSPEEPVDEPTEVNVANDDVIEVFADALFDDMPEEFTFGGPTILSNDITDDGATVSAYTGAVTAVQGVDVDAEPVIVQGSNGGLLMVFPDGSVDFSGNGDFDDVTALDTDQTLFTYEIDGGDTAMITVNVLGVGDDGGGLGGGLGDDLFL